jgi:succinate dehydrogenase / fumarate reductase cytochrome b subunit
MFTEKLIRGTNTFGFVVDFNHVLLLQSDVLTKRHFADSQADTMNLFSGLFGSSLGKKYIMAITGLVMVGFVVVHMLGNLQVFLGPEAINDYGYFLQSKPELVWPARIGLLVAVVLHIWAAIKLSAENKAARPKGYGNYKIVAASYASRTMLVSGFVLLAFIIYHLMHFTVQVQGINFANTNFLTLEDAKHHHDIYNMIIIGFSQPLVAIFYIVSMCLLSLHLSHGISSMFQSLGWKNRKYGVLIDRLALVVAGILVVGYSAIPIAVLTGILKKVSYGA